MGNSVVYSKQNNADIRRVVYVPKYDAEVEYLQSSGTQWIDTKIIATNNTSIDTGFLRVPYKLNFYIVGARPSGYKNNEYAITPYTNGACSIIYGNAEDTNLNSPIVNNTYYRCVTNKNRLSLYDSEGTIVTSVVASTNSFNTQYSLAVFGENRGGTVLISDVKLRLYYLKIYDNTTLVRDFIPVRVGSTGYMYDKVSGQLFGNSGTGNFVLGQDVAKPIVKRYVVPSGLEEGVDYQRYDWLKANIPISTTMMNLPINSQNIEFKRDFLQIMNSGYITINSNYSYFITDYPSDNSKMKIKIWNAVTQSTVMYDNVVQSLGLHNIICTEHNITINNSVFPWYGDVSKGIFIRFNNASNYNKSSIFRTSFIKINGIIRYVPCQLLRPIPARFDANGIARQQGECGMIDLISGKFYGNVASSGSFTVENDND